MVAFIILCYLFWSTTSNNWDIISSITEQMSIKTAYALIEYPNNDQMLIVKMIDQYKTFEIRNITIHQKKLTQNDPKYLYNHIIMEPVYPQVFLTSNYKIIFYYEPNMLIIFENNSSNGSIVDLPFDSDLSLIILQHQNTETYFYAVNKSQNIIKFRILRDDSDYVLDLIGSTQKINTNTTKQDAFLMKNYYCIHGLLYNLTTEKNYSSIQCYSIGRSSLEKYHDLIGQEQFQHDIFPFKNSTQALIVQNKTSVSKLSFDFNSQQKKMQLIIFKIDIIQNNIYLPNAYSLWIISEKEFGVISQDGKGNKICIFSLDRQNATLFQILKIDLKNSVLYNIFSLRDHKTQLFLFQLIDSIHQAQLITNSPEQTNSQKIFEIILWVLIFIAVFSMKIKLFKSSYIKLCLKQLIRKKNYMIELVSVISIYIFSFLIVLQLDSSKHSNQLSFLSSFQEDHLIGSLYLNLHYQMFLFLTLITAIFEVYHEYQYSNNFLTYHCKHGLRITTFMLYQLSRISIKAAVNSIISTFYILILQKMYCNEELQVLNLNYQLFEIIVLFYFCMISLVAIAIILSKTLNSYYFSLMVFLFLCFCLSYYTELFSLQIKITSFQKVFVFVWPATFFSSFSQNLYKSQLRFATETFNQFSMMIVATVLSYLLQSIYVAIIGYNYNKIDFNSLVKVKLNPTSQRNQEKINKNTTVITTNTFRQSFQGEDNLLQVFIPRKLNLKGRLQKNKVLENIKFAANKGQIISFIDIENQSKKALMKILINDQKSDTIIEEQLKGIVQYSQSVKLSYCFDKDIYLSDLTIRQNLELFYSFKNPAATKQQSALQVQKIIEIFDIPDHFSGQKAKNLSGGSLKKMCLACSLIGNPSVVLLEDPTVGLDASFQKRFWQKLVKLKQDKLIIIFTTNAQEVQGISDKIWYFQDARIRKQQQIRRKRKRMEIEFQMFSQNSYLRCLEYINQLKQTNKIVDTTKTSSRQLDHHRISLVLYDFDEKQVFEIIKKMMKRVTNMNNFQSKQCCHFSFRIKQRMMSLPEIRKLIHNQTRFLRQSGNVSRQFLDIVQGQFGKDEQFNNYQSPQSLRQTQLSVEKHLFERFNSIHQNRKFNKAIFQIKSLFLRKRYFYQNPKTRKWLFIPQLFIQVYLFSKLLISSGQFIPIKNRYGQIMTLVIVTWLLQTKIFHLYSHDRSVGILEYYKSIGLSEIYYWIGSFFFDFFTNFLPFFINIAFVIIIASIFSIQFNGFEYIWTSLLFGIGHLLFTIILCQFISSQANIQAILISSISYYMYVSENVYIRAFLQRGFQDVLGYILYPITIKRIFQNQSHQDYLLSLIGQYLIMIATILIILHLKNRRENRQVELIYHNNISNSFIQNERIQIDQIINKSAYVLGNNITHSYKQKDIIKNIYFKAELGQIVGFFGPNGCGKTTIFKIIMNLLNQNSGYLQYFGRNKKQFRSNGRLNIGCCPQFDQLDYNLTVQQNVRTVGIIKGLKDSEISKFIAIFMKYLKFQGNQSVLVSDLSVSERKKTNFMISFIGFPTILVIDETSTGLDPQNSKRCLNLLRQYSHQYRKIVFLTSHNLKQGEQYCDKVYILKNGTLTASGSPKQLKNDPSQELYKLIIYFSRAQNDHSRNQDKAKVKGQINKEQFKNLQFENNFTICYSFDMLKVNLNKILEYCLSFYGQRVIDQFQLYKYGMIEIAMYHTKNANATVMVQYQNQK